MLQKPIKLHADAGSSQTIQIINDEGATTGSDGMVRLILKLLMVVLDYVGTILKIYVLKEVEPIITVNQDVSEAIKLHADAGSSQTIQIINDEGITTGSDGTGAIDIEATNGGIGLRWNNSKNLWVEGGRTIITANENASESY